MRGKKENVRFRTISSIALDLAVNVALRHLTSGQRAMAMALAYPEPGQRGRGNKFAGSGDFPEVPHQRLADARTVLDQHDLVEKVLAGTMSQRVLVRFDVGGPFWRCAVVRFRLRK
jgi:hypothetical protein